MYGFDYVFMLYFYCGFDVQQEFVCIDGVYVRMYLCMDVGVCMGA